MFGYHPVQLYLYDSEETIKGFVAPARPALPESVAFGLQLRNAGLPNGARPVRLLLSCGLLCLQWLRLRSLPGPDIRVAGCRDCLHNAKRPRGVAFPFPQCRLM